MSIYVYIFGVCHAKKIMNSKNPLFLRETLIIDKHTIKSSFDKIKIIAKNDKNCNLLYNNLEARTKNIVYKNQMKINRYFKNFKISVDDINYNLYKDKNLMQGQIYINYEYTTINDINKNYDDNNTKLINGKMLYDFYGNIENCSIRLGNYKDI